MTIYHDDFTGGNGTPLAGRELPLPGGVEWSTVANNFVIINNRASSPVLGSAGYAQVIHNLAGNKFKVCCQVWQEFNIGFINPLSSEEGELRVRFANETISDFPDPYHFYDTIEIQDMTVTPRESHYFRLGPLDTVIHEAGDRICLRFEIIGGIIQRWHVYHRASFSSTETYLGFTDIIISWPNIFSIGVGETGGAITWIDDLWIWTGDDVPPDVTENVFMRNVTLIGAN